MWNDLMTLGVSAPEKILRTVLVYLALAVLLRLAGKRDLAQLNSFDLVVILLLSNVVQNAVIGPDNSLLGGLIGAAVLVGFNSVVVRLSIRSSNVERWVEGTPTVLARDGRWDDRALKREGLRKGDVIAALRRQNANDVSEADEVSIQPGGAIVTSLRPGQQAATKAQVDSLIRADRQALARIEAKLDRLLAVEG
jgi:uncharacterized membrane protein YcaP (DUF421 family)